MVRKATAATPVKSNGKVDADEFAITSWSKAKDYKKPYKFKCPSGQMTLIHRLDMADLLKLGIAEDLDLMAKTLMSSEETAKEAEAKPDKPDEALSEMIKNAENFGKLERTINLVCNAGVIKPKLYLPPRDEAARQEGLTYVDAIFFEDRMALFTEIFDSEGLSTFRQEQKDGVGDVANVSSIQLPAE
jgi:hypothetical protein